jgi:hypothetical protein
MSDEFEKALQRALRPHAPAESFDARVAARLESAAAAPAAVAQLDSRRRRVWRSRWLPAALAAGIIAGIGLRQLRQHSAEADRASAARAQLLQALSIASDNINIVRAAVAREEDPNS